jgi:diguanylate cyclase (GGDEF)-like protein
MTETAAPERAPASTTEALLACLLIGKALTSTYNISEILALIMEKVSELIHAQNWSLLLKDEASGELTFEIVVGIDQRRVSGVRIAPGEGIAGRVARTGEMEIVSDVHRTAAFNRKVDQMTGFETRSIACVPLKTHGKVLGVIELINLKDMASFRSTDLPVLGILADYAAVAIENSRFFQKIQRMSQVDEYTGLYNARYLHEELARRVQAADAGGPGLTVVFVDMDNFKKVVDTYGHLAGSRVLKEVGEVIGGCLSADDILIKYGGDEYVILLPGREKAEALALIETVIAALRAAWFLRSEKVPLKVTASFGLASYPGDAGDQRELLLRADRAMYRVKRSTKDGVAAT